MHARISMSELNEPEDRSMITHARDKCACGAFYFSLTSFIGKYGSTSYIGMTRKKNGGQ